LAPLALAAAAILGAHSESAPPPAWKPEVGEVASYGLEATLRLGDESIRLIGEYREQVVEVLGDGGFSVEWRLIRAARTVLGEEETVADSQPRRSDRVRWISAADTEANDPLELLQQAIDVRLPDHVRPGDSWARQLAGQTQILYRAGDVEAGELSVWFEMVRNGQDGPRISGWATLDAADGALCALDVHIADLCLGEDLPLASAVIRLASP
jgi:hypothetical protein